MNEKIPFHCKFNLWGYSTISIWVRNFKALQSQPIVFLTQWRCIVIRMDMLKQLIEPPLPRRDALSWKWEGSRPIDEGKVCVRRDFQSDEQKFMLLYCLNICMWNSVKKTLNTILCHKKSMKNPKISC